MKKVTPAPQFNEDTGAIVKEEKHRCKRGWLGKKPTLDDLCAALGAELIVSEAIRGRYRTRIDNRFAIRNANVPDLGPQYFAHAGMGKSIKSAKRDFLRRLRGKIIWSDYLRGGYQCWVVPKNFKLD
jgi:hypothetical protein